MKKNYCVEMFSEMMDAEMNTVTLEEAVTVYERMKGSEYYHSGHIYSLETGEVLRHFSARCQDGGRMVIEWTQK